MTSTSNKASSNTGIELVLFDLGGVLIEFGGIEAMQALSGIDDEAELWRRWLECEWVRAFERGHCSPSEFAQGVVDDWQLSITGDEYLASFIHWVRGPYPGAVELVGDVSTVIATGCLSNTNDLHWKYQFEHNPMLASFSPCFLSYELGLVKPDAEIFEHVVEHVGCDPSAVLFLDDNIINVDGARACGLNAHLAQGVDAARAVLEQVGVLP